MKAALCVTAACAAVALALSPAAAASRSTSGDAQLASIAAAYYQDEWRFSPGDATAAGVHDYDTQLARVDPETFAREIYYLRTMLARVAEIPPAALSLDGQVDRELLEDAIELRLYDLETRPAWQNSPDFYVGVGSNSIFSVMARDFAPAEKRLVLVIGRERRIPAMLEQAEKNLDPAQISAIAAQVGSDDAVGAASFLRGDVALAFRGVGTPSLQRQFKSSTAQAAAAYTQYASFIKTAIAPNAHASFAIGRVAYSYLERLQNVAQIPLSKLLTVGQANLAKDRAAFITTARRINPKQTPQQVMASLQADHPSADQLFASAQADLVTLVDFIKSHTIIDLPDAPIAKVVPTPQFERQFTFASMDSPGPLETKATQAYYNITPVEPSWTQTEKDQHLAFFNRYQIMIVSAHETYPGHYVNYLFNKRAKLSLIRKMEWNNAFGEGWAHYDEQMMVDEGLGGGDPRYRLAQLSGALLRDCRYVVGIKEHTQGMTIDQATQFFEDNAFVGREPAHREAVRGTQDPLYGYYTLGKLMLLKLRADEQRKMGAAFSLSAFHDALLSHGDPPIYYLRKLLLGANDNGSLL